MTAGNPQDGENVETGAVQDGTCVAVEDGNCVGVPVDRTHRLDADEVDHGGAVQDGNCMGVPMNRAQHLGTNGNDRGVGMSNPMDASDADEHDVGETAASNQDELPLRPLPRQARRQANRQQARTQERSRPPNRNDTSNGHLPLQVENDIADLDTFLSLMQPQDVARVHEFGPTLEEYAVKGVHVDCGADWT